MKLLRLFYKKSNALVAKKVIYIIPSWYPTKASPNFGSFIKEQSYLIAKHHPELIFIVGIRSDYDLLLNLKQPFHILYHLLRNSFKITRIKYIKDNLIEIENPAFSLRNFPKIFTAKQRNSALHRINVKYCEKNLGNIRIIHAHVANPGGVIALNLARQLHVPFMITEHRKGMIQQLLKDKRAEYIEFMHVVQQADEFVAVSKDQAKFIKSVCNRLPIVIPNFVDENLFIPKASSRYPEYFVFSTLSGLIEGKGLDTLLKAIKLWMPERDKVHFKIGGTGYLKDSLQSMALELKISHLITWTGFVSREQAPAFYQDSDAFVLPSRSESFGIVYIEALACGLPVIATRCGGPEEIVNNLNGLLIDIDDVEQLVIALKKMYQNYNQYDRGAIRDDFITRFSSRVGATRIMDVYNKLIN